MAAAPPGATIRIERWHLRPPPDGDTTMDKFARRIWFERLCDLRDAYGRLGREDKTSAISIEAMIARSRTLMAREESPLVAILEQEQRTA
jgi:flagellar biosynthesis regulator FlaF